MSNEVRVVSDDEAEAAQFMVCARADTKTPFTDNLYDFCCGCGVKVQFRPNAPTVPKKICFACAIPEMNKHAENNDLQINVSKEGAEIIKRKLGGN